VHAAGLRLGTAGRRRAAGVALVQLRAVAYRESRLSLGLAERLGGQGLQVAASLFGLTAGTGPAPVPFAAALDLGWEVAVEQVVIAARAPGVLRTRGAAALAVPHGTSLAVRTRTSRVRADLELEEGSRGGRLKLGLVVAPRGGLEVGAAWSSVEPPVRLLLGIDRGGIGVAAGWAWNSVLPPTTLVAIRRTARPGGSPAAGDP
jgi:hypothetical protein